MRLLLDTHILIWAAAYQPGAPGRMPARAVELIRDDANALFFSAASIWEATVKHALGRIDFPTDPHLLRRGLIDAGYTELVVTSVHALAVSTLPNHHRDPFDRLLVAQAMAEGITLLTSDAMVASYPGPILKV